MPAIISAAEAIPAHRLEQGQVMEFARDLFSESFKDVERLLKAFHNGQIHKRHFAKGMDWYRREHSFEEKNQAFIECAVELGAEAIRNCLHNRQFLGRKIDYSEIDAIFMVTSTGISTPSLDARIMNVLPFSQHTKRIPLWGLGCAGGASGLSRAYEYCLAYPKAKVIVLAVELCSLTFQKNDRSKSNLIGTSLFADGAACVLMAGDQAELVNMERSHAIPRIIGTASTTMPDSLDVMGWDVRNEGLYVVFSKDIPSIIENWLKPNVESFLKRMDTRLDEIDHFVAHPGGKKVLDAYVTSLQFSPHMTDISLQVLKEFGNMSSATILYVLRRFMEKGKAGELGIAAALGPGFSSELLLLRWE
ncbi:type III polyketide synthase [Bacillus infantis]|uniref:Type III polyketide synthase n=1 Tax=Bacillus infantis TaxID=324767 RepID=A0A5D4SX92_9BACI|nr:3-oxoacyl-[acyl-carrier-protein] synthase III C-terminal domain-containing protein [Bacillus infantis]TYS66624.1 type III polyketide synthase [Bacillus infantis]